jgi:hypothetical protein
MILKKNGMMRMPRSRKGGKSEVKCGDVSADELY